MICTYLRSSSYNVHSDCENKYFQEYVLGYKTPSYSRTDAGTAVHKVYEILSSVQLARQNHINEIDDDIIGKLDTQNNLDINKLMEQVFYYYADRIDHHAWSDNKTLLNKEDHLKFCTDSIEKVLTHRGGRFHPFNLNIVASEQNFDIEIPNEWAKYSYKLQNGETLEGNLAIKGTMDLVTKVNNDTIEYIDLKTGSRKDWITGKMKTPETLQKDPQLLIYLYALKNLYPAITTVMSTMFYMNDGGPQTVVFGDDDLKYAEEILEKKFKRIKSVKIPTLTVSSKCRYACHFGKTTFEGTSIKPIKEFRSGQAQPVGTTMSKCAQVQFETQRKGLDRVIEEYSVPNFEVGYYKKPGAI